MKTIELDDPWLLSISKKLRNQLELSHKHDGQIIYAAIIRKELQLDGFKYPIRN